MNYLKLTGLLLLSAAITACSGTSEERIAKREQVSQQQNEWVAQSEVLVTSFQQRLDKAKEDNLRYFAPEQLETAIEEFNDAREEFDEIAIDKTEADEDQVGKIAEYVQKANMALDAAYTIKSNTETILEESFDIRTQLQKLGAPTIKSFSRAYRSLSEDIDDIVEDIADGDLEDAREDNGELLPKLRALEVSVVKHIELAESRSRLAALKKARATHYIPNTHKLAIASVRTAESTIANDPRNKEQINQSVDNATFQLDHARHILQAVQELNEIEPEAAERYITKYENQLHKIGQSAGTKDVRNLSLTKQFAAINTVVLEIKQQLDLLQASSQSSNDAAAMLLQREQNKSTALEQLVTAKQQELELQKQNNTQLQIKLVELETQLLRKEKQVLELEKAKLQIQTTDGI